MDLGRQANFARLPFGKFSAENPET